LPSPAEIDLNAMTLEQKVGQLVIARLPDWKLMEKYAAEGLISGMTPSLKDKAPAEVAEFTNRFQELSRYPLLFGWSGISYSGGTDVRLGQAMRLGATRSKELCYQAAKIEAEEARALGFHFVSTPNVDVNTNPDNPIINLRSLGDDPALVTELAAELCRGAIDGGGAPLLMHFPGHGATASDSHIAIPEVPRSLAELEAIDLKPFAELIRRGLAPVICTNHCHYPALEPDRQVPATVSRRIVTGLLREKLGFDGVILSDSLTMRAMKDNYGIEEGAIAAVAAGHDLILQDYQSDPKITVNAVARAVQQGRIPLAQVEASVRRVWKLKQSVGLPANRFVDVEKIPQCLATPEHQAVARRIARDSVTVLENHGLPLGAGDDQRILVVSNGSTATVDQDLAWKHMPTNHRLNEQVRRRSADARTIVLSADVAAKETNRALDAARQSEIVIFGLFTRVRSYVEDAIRLKPRYRELIRRVNTLAPTVVVINFGNPWSLCDLPRPSISLYTFSDATDSIDAAVEVLFGEQEARGRLPVRISDAYPFGYGLTPERQPS
jgi:beta-N-acetylhexosaminidase